MNDCQGCSMFGKSCIIRQSKLEQQCPCRECIVKITCYTDLCMKYKYIVDFCHRRKENAGHM
jgi:hypothetical protein